MAGLSRSASTPTVKRRPRNTQGRTASIMTGLPSPGQKRRHKSTDALYPKAPVKKEK